MKMREVVDKLREAHTAVSQRTTFSCDRCEWFGDDPNWIDTGDTFQPPRGEVPRCPLCSSYQVTLLVIE